MEGPAVRLREFGKSTMGQRLEAFELGQGPCALALVGGLHGDEIEGIQLLASVLREAGSRPELQALGRAASLLAVPVVNRDGFALASRWTRARVDLNRNFPSS